jgi:hypothetical protein
MRRFLPVLAGVLLLAQAPAAYAELTDEQSERLARAFGILADGPNQQAGRYVLDFLQTTSVTEEDWRTFFLETYDPAWFTETQAEFWRRAVASSGAQASRVARMSAYAAASAFGSGAAEEALGDDATQRLALNWLGEVSPRLGPPQRAAVLDVLQEALGDRAQNLVTWGAAEKPGPDALRVALLLSRYAQGTGDGGPVLTRLLKLPPGHRHLWEQTGILLFDNAALNEGQVNSLHNVAAVIPGELHRIVAVVVPGAVDIDPRSPEVDAGGQLVFVENVPLTRPTDPDAFIPRIGQPVASLFTINAVEAFIGAAQEVQFAARPGLQVQRDLILARAGDLHERYLRRDVQPAFYLGNPDRLLPAVAHMWFIDSGRAFRQARELFQFEQQQAMESVLLLADLLSGGATQSYLYQTDPSGRVNRRGTPIARSRVAEVQLPGEEGASPPVPVSIEVVTAIAINGFGWTFELDVRGGLNSWTRR